MAIPAYIVAALKTKEGRAALRTAAQALQKGKNKAVSKAKGSEVPLTDPATIASPSIEQRTKDGIDTFNMLRRVSGVTPQQLLIKAGLAAGADTLRAIGDTRVNNANALATALLSRNQTEQQRTANGINPADLARQNWATHRMRDAQNIKRVLDIPAKAIDAAAGAYNYGTGMAGMLAANQALGQRMPGLFYSAATQAMKHGGFGPTGAN